MKSIAFSLLAVASLLVQANGADEETRRVPGSLRELVEQAVDEVEILTQDDAETVAKSLIVLRWANNTRGSEDGATVLYLHQGRPIAANCVFPWEEKIIHELSAIGRGNIVARLKGNSNILWRPQKSGVDFVNVPGAPEPDATPASRLRQMKALSEQFKVTMVGWNPGDKQQEELRLLPRPLYRYESMPGDLIDGAVFAFVSGTDPEALLMLEAITVENKPTWQYGLVRRTSAGLEARHLDAAIWTAERRPDAWNPQGSLFTIQSPIPAELRTPASRP